MLKGMSDAARLTWVWAALSVATLLSWGLSKTHDAPAQSSVVVTVGVLVVALVKVRLILRYFMEVGTAPTWLRRVTDGWLIVFGATVLVIYLA
jgi:hypothetical protein